MTTTLTPVQTSPSNSIATDEWLTTEDFCVLLKISLDTAKKWFAAGPKSGKCPRYVVNGKCRRIHRSWYEEWVATLTERASA